MLTDFQEVKLSNSRVSLDVFKPEDFNEIETMLESTEDYCFFGDFLHKREVVERLNSRSILSHSEPSNVIWSIRRKDDEAAVGIAGFLPDPLNEQKTQMIWFACLDMITKKHAAMVVHMLIQYAFQYHKMIDVSIYVPSGQKKHKSIARQIGLKFQKYLWKDNKAIDFYLLRR